MGACHEQKADRTRFIIDEDLKIKEEMLQSIQAFTEKRREEQGLVIQRKSNEEQEKVKKEKNSTAQNSLIKRRDKKICEHSLKQKNVLFLETENYSIRNKETKQNSSLNNSPTRKKHKKLTFAPKIISMERYYAKKKLMAKNFLFNEVMGNIQNIQS